MINNKIYVFDSLSRQKKELKAIDSNHLKMYVCGPTVYDRPHLGNARSIVVYDLFFRFFRIAFKKVTYVRNITDVDDKINKSAKEQGISINELTAKIIDFFHNDTDALQVLRPNIEPKATENISEMIAMIEKLIKSGNAYISQNHVLFDVKSYDKYGELSNRKIDDMIAGARIEIADYKKDPLDFVLWKPADDEDDESSIFASPWGNGRPGWHIECSAMSSKYLGVNFDIHGGGADLQFPHHENEIAQSRCANNSKYANFWVHNGFLTVNGEKMSKSLKNFITVYDLLQKNISGVVIRYLLLMTHYRKPLDFNQKALIDAEKSIIKFYENLNQNDFIDFIDLERQFKNADFRNKNMSYVADVLEAMADDLNIARVIAILHDVSKIAKKDQEVRAQFVLILNFLGLVDKDLLKNQSQKNTNSKLDENYIESQIKLRQQAKLDHDYEKADQIRDNLLQNNIVIKDLPDGKTSWYNKS